MFKEDIELRKMPAGSLAEIINILEVNEGWKRVISKIPRDPSSNHFVPKYNEEHIRRIEDHSKDTGLKCTEILLDEWGTSGRIRPTLCTLKEVLYKSKDELYRAAVEIALLLNEPLPQRPNIGPAAPITIDLTKLLNTETGVQNYNNIPQAITNNQAIFNQTTAEVGGEDNTHKLSESDMMKFSSENNRPNLSILQPELHKAATHVMEDSHGNNSTASNIPNITILQRSYKSNQDLNEESINIPNIIAMGTPSESKFSTGQSFTQSTAYISESSSHSNYQTSLPNIEVQTSATVDDSIFEQTNLTKFKYVDIVSITDNFSMEIGRGGFGVVFKGTHPSHGTLAIKKEEGNGGIRQDKMMKAFINEVISLSMFDHENILPVLGFSTDGPALCIISEYVDGGSLHVKIQEKVLNEKQRVNIMIGTAEGLRYLHSNSQPAVNLNKVNEPPTSKRGNFVHGDVKTANILLTKDFIPKLCDFGLAKQCDVTYLLETRTVSGTSAYMAPERFTGTVTQKSDIYSYGIVLLELLTGAEPIVNIDGETKNIKDYVEDSKSDIAQILDPAVNWTKADIIYELAEKCLVYRRQDRPSIEEICDIMHRVF